MAITPPSLPSDREKQGGGSVAAQRVGFVFKVAQRDAEIGHQLRIAQRHGLAADFAGNALAGDGREVRRLLNRNIAIPRGGDDGRGEGMFARPLKTGCQWQNFGLR